MKIKYALIALALVSTTAFANKDIPSAKKGQKYGKSISAKKAVSINDLSSKLDANNTFQGKIEGKVVEVCKKKGCFMKLEQANGQPIMVKFKDYAFFMPQDMVGKTVVLEGKATVTETSVSRLKHYAEDAGKSKEEIAKITAPVKAINILADGVIVKK